MLDELMAVLPILHLMCEAAMRTVQGAAMMLQDTEDMMQAALDTESNVWYTECSM